MPSRKPYPRVTISGDAAAEILRLSTAWNVSPEDVVRRLCADATLGRGTAAAVKVGVAVLDHFFTPAPVKEIERDPGLDVFPLLPPARRDGR